MASGWGSQDWGGHAGREGVEAAALSLHRPVMTFHLGLQGHLCSHRTASREEEAAGLACPRSHGASVARNHSVITPTSPGPSALQTQISPPAALPLAPAQSWGSPHLSVGSANG